MFNHCVALYGMGGVGKTQVALEYVFRYKSEYKYVFWIAAHDLANLLSGFQEIAQTTQCVETDGKDAVSLARDVVKWLGKQNSWLLVLDNVDDIYLVSHYLPNVHAGNGNLLITTRNPYVNDIPAQGLEVTVFDTGTAVEMLLLHSNVTEKQDDDIQLHAVEIVNELGLLPLAIEQAATYIRVFLKDISKFKAIYSSSRERFLHERPATNWNYPYSVATTWSLSFSIVQERNSEAAELLNLLAFLNPDAILVEFLEAGRHGLHEPLKTLIGDSVKFNKAVGILEQYSLIRRSHMGQIISIHRLVQAVIKENLSQERERQFMETAVALFLSAFPVFEENNRQICRRYQVQVLGPLRTISKICSKDVADMSERLGYFLNVDGKFEDAEQLQRSAIDIYRYLFGSENARTLKAMSNIGETYLALGQMKDAETLQNEVLETRRRILGDEHPDTLTSMNNLALTYDTLGRTQDAEALQERVLEAQRRILGDEHPDTLRSMNNLALTYDTLGRTKDAEALQGRVLEAQQRILGEEHPDTLRSMSNLAVTYGNLGRTNEAAVLQEKVLESYQRILGEEHPDTLRSMANLAAAYCDLGQTKEAAALRERVLEAQQRILGDEHPDALRSMNNLAVTYGDLGRMNKAAALQEKVLESYQRILGDEHPDTLRTMNNLALTYGDLGRTNEAAVLQEKVQEVYQRIFGEDHPHKLRSKAVGIAGTATAILKWQQ
jgi:tetratricopeptide (TPR) repeat protein